MKPEPRIETGTAQFGSDWPCVVLRGDNALYLAMVLRQALENPSLINQDLLGTKLPLQGLVQILNSANAFSDQTDTQRFRPFSECLLEAGTGSGSQNDG